MEEILTASKAASYNPIIKESYQLYKKNGRRAEIYNDVSQFVNQQYKYDRHLLCAMVFFLDEPENIFYTYNTYLENNSKTSGYSRVVEFQNNSIADVLELSAGLDTREALITNNGHLYMVRNLVGSDFQPYGMIVIELSPQFVFESLTSVWGAMEYEVFLDDTPLLDSSFGEKTDLDRIRAAVDPGVTSSSTKVRV